MPDMHFYPLCSYIPDQHQSITLEEGRVALGFEDRAGREELA